jgi:hypothetical protein
VSQTEPTPGATSAADPAPATGASDPTAVTEAEATAQAQAARSATTTGSALPPAIPDPLLAFDAAQVAAFAGVAGYLIPAAHDMPSAGEVVGEARLRFVLESRPDLIEPLGAALRPALGDDPATRLATLERDEPDLHGALVSTVVFGYYTDKGVRERLGYPGQEAITLYSWKVPDFMEEGLIDPVLARGPVWRDPETGRRADPVEHAPRPTWRDDATS